MIIFPILFSLCGLGLFACSFMLARNKWLYVNVLKMLQEDYERYELLPRYEDMLNKFWVWDLNKFIKSQQEK